MALRKPLFMSTDGFSEQMAATDSLALGGLTMSGAIAMGTNPITGLEAADASGEALSFGQSGAELNGLDVQSAKITSVAAGSAAGDALMFGQSGAELDGLDVQSAKITSVAAGAAAGDALMFGQSGAELDGLDVQSAKITSVAAGAAAGDALMFGQSGAKLSGLDADSQKITALANGTTTNDAVNYGQLQSAIAGLNPKSNVSVLKLKSDADQSGSDPGAPTDGDAWVVNNWSTQSDGDIVEWDGSAWNTVVANSGGSVPNGTRAVIIDTSAAGSFSGHEDDMAEYSGSWSFESPANGDYLFVDGTTSIYENQGYIYDGTPGEWVMFNGLGSISAGLGLTKTGNTINVGAGDGIATSADQVSADLGNGLQPSAVGGQTEIKLDETANDSGSGLACIAAGLSVKIDNTPDTLDADSSGLKVVGLPALFKVNGTAVGADVTGPNLDTLTDGSNADALHTHSDGTATSTPLVKGSFEASGAISKGDPVYASGVDVVSEGTAGTDAQARIIGVAEAGISDGASGNIVSLGKIASAGSFTTGAPQYLGASGGLTESVPGGGNRVILIGYALNTTDLFVAIHDYGKKAA